MKQRPRIYYTETDKALMWDQRRSSYCGPQAIWRYSGYNAFLRSYYIVHLQGIRYNSSIISEFSWGT